MPVIRFENLKKNYNNVEVIHDLNLVMNNNEFTVFVGPSGCGKSTTLRMIAGLENISDGKITMDDKDVSHLEPIDRDIAMVFQDYALYPHMNVAKNMSFGLRLAKYPKEEINKRVKQAAQMLGLDDLLDRKPAELSGGQRQRVAMGRALVRDSATLLMDEPLSNLDAKLRSQMRAELAIMREKIQKNIIYVTHDQVEAMTLGDRIVVMYGGHIQQHGTPKELFERPYNKFVAGFIGMPPMNFMAGQLAEVNGKLHARGAGFDFELNRIENTSALPENGEVIIGIRPSSLIPANSKSINNSLSLPIKVVEYVGSQSVLISEHSGHRIVAEVNSETSAQVGDVIEFSVDSSNIYLFNRNTELAIY